MYFKGWLFSRISQNKDDWHVACKNIREQEFLGFRNVKKFLNIDFENVTRKSINYGKVFLLSVKISSHF